MNSRYSVAFALAIVFMAAHRGAHSQAETPQLAGLSPAERQTVDARAMKTPLLDVKRAKVRLYTNAAGWLVARSPLPKAEERRRIAAADAAFRTKHRAVETPAAAKAVLRRLTAALPAPMPAETTSLVVFDDDEWDAQTVGGGRVFISQGYLRALTADKQRGTDRLAFVLAQQIGHDVRGHCRFAYKLLWLQDQLDERADREVDRRVLRAAIRRAVSASGKLLRFSYDREQVRQADLFALHLCRNAGFDVENGLDVLRSEAAGDNPEALRRLRRLRMELDGDVGEAKYALHEFDPANVVLGRSADKSIRAGEHVVVFLHGMESNAEIYLPLMQQLAKNKGDRKLRILALSYPNDGSLARSGKFLKREIDRVCPGAKHIDFVGHSAGGLVFRHYAEVERGRFRRAVFLGTPHAGSDLARLRDLLEPKQFFGDLPLGYPKALERTIVDGRGQMAFDLQPDSLFLRHLNAAEKVTRPDDYHIFRGRALSERKAALLRFSVAFARRRLNKSLKKIEDKPQRHAAAKLLIERLRLPAEITRGDLAVTLDSAALKGVKSVETHKLNHAQLYKDEKVIESVVELILSGE
ncbi:MAG: alpha/beta fold hydrolase [Planctomycetes bacterium]|nr:alpha/beta fold hydrolase [Planctomycetota bacterium]